MRICCNKFMRHSVNRAVIAGSLFFMMVLSPSTAIAVSGDSQFQLATYFDSNASEAKALTYSTFGLSLRGMWQQDYSRNKFRMNGQLLGQAFLDPTFGYGEKYILRGHLDMYYNLSKTSQIYGSVVRFQKVLNGDYGTYARTEYQTQILVFPSPEFSATFGYKIRTKLLQYLTQYRFTEQIFETQVKYRFNSQYHLVTSIRGRTLHHQDLKARSMGPSGNLVNHTYSQRDWGFEVSTNLRYSGAFLAGIQLGAEAVSSNSDLNQYDMVFLHTYFTTRLGTSTYAHLVFKLINKHYRYPHILNESLYRDPEEALQNLFHLRFEKEFPRERIIYLQFSLLSNETTINRQYYEKAFIETGFKYSF